MKKANNFFQHSILFLALLCFAMNVNGQVKIGSNPTTIEATSNLEVEASTAGRKVKVNKTTGQLTIKDGTEGMDKILTSDANGAAIWKAPEVLGIDKTVFIGRQYYPDPTKHYQLITQFNGTFNAIKDRIMMEPATGSLSGWDLVQRDYVIQEAGNYRIFAGAFMQGTLPSPRVTVASLYLAPWHVLHQYIGIDVTLGPAFSVMWEGYLPVNYRVNLYVTNNKMTGPEQDIQVKNGFLSVVKLAY
jgi:hypothetical protein